LQIVIKVLVTKTHCTQAFNSTILVVMCFTVQIIIKTKTEEKVEKLNDLIEQKREVHLGT